MDGPTIAFDIYRVREGTLLKHGSLIEHWDVLQKEVTGTVSGRSMTDGPTEIEDRERTAANKELVTNLVQNVLIGGRGELARYINADTYVQHNPNIGDGLPNLMKAVEDMAKAGQPMRYERLHHVVAEGNFVFTHCEGMMLGRHTAFADLFRVEKGRIVEHWDTTQEVPATSKNKNSMF